MLLKPGKIPNKRTTTIESRGKKEGGRKVKLREQGFTLCLVNVMSI